MRVLIVSSLVVFLAGCTQTAWDSPSKPSNAGSVVSQQKQGRITNYETEGNLAATRSATCVDVRQLSSHHTPADIYPGVSDCLAKGDVNRAAELSALAYVYGYYDRLRVADRSAHQATQVLQLNHLSVFEEDVAQKMIERVGQISDDDEARNALCDEIKLLGRPSYHPAYMIEHGIQAFSGSRGGNGLVPGFSEKQGWQKALDGGLHCPD